MAKKRFEVVSEDRDGDTSVYTLSGSLFGSSASYAFQDEVRQKIASGTRKIIIDLATVERIDSSGIGILVALMWSASQGGAGLILAALSAKVEQVLSIAMLLDHIDHAPSVADALARLDQMDLKPASD